MNLSEPFIHRPVMTAVLTLSVVNSCRSRSVWVRDAPSSSVPFMRVAGVNVAILVGNARIVILPLQSNHKLGKCEEEEELPEL